MNLIEKILLAAFLLEGIFLFIRGVVFARMMDLLVAVNCFVAVYFATFAFKMFEEEVKE